MQIDEQAETKGHVWIRPVNPLMGSPKLGWLLLSATHQHTQRMHWVRGTLPGRTRPQYPPASVRARLEHDTNLNARELDQGDTSCRAHSCERAGGGDRLTPELTNTHRNWNWEQAGWSRLQHPRAHLRNGSESRSGQAPPSTCKGQD